MRVWPHGEGYSQLSELSRQSSVANGTFNPKPTNDQDYSTNETSHANENQRAASSTTLPPIRHSSYNWTSIAVKPGATVGRTIGSGRESRNTDGRASGSMSRCGAEHTRNLNGVYHTVATRRDDIDSRYMCGRATLGVGQFRVRAVSRITRRHGVGVRKTRDIWFDARNAWLGYWVVFFCRRG